MIKKIFLICLALFFLMNCVSAIDSSDWATAEVGEETFKIPPEYSKYAYKNDSDIYWYDEDSNDIFTIRYVNSRLMDLYGYHLEHSSDYKKVKVAGHDAVHFKSTSKIDGLDYYRVNCSILWFSAGEEFYYIKFEGHEITPTIEEVVNSCSKSNFTHDEFYDILKEEYMNYKITDAIESQRFDYPSQPKGMYSYGSSGGYYGLFNY